MSGDLLACTADVAEEECVEGLSLAVYGWVQCGVDTILTALFLHVCEGRVVGWRLDAFCFHHFAEVVLVSLLEEVTTESLKGWSVLPGRKEMLGSHPDWLLEIRGSYR